MASILKVDDLRGNTAAGDITITSEGGGATQSLQQGLLKFWTNYNGTSTPTARDSLNSSSITDTDSGDHSQNFTNNFSSVNYAVGGSIRNSFDGSADNRNNATHGIQMKGNANPTTSTVRIISTMGSTAGSNGGQVDYWQVNVTAAGDLA